VLFAATQAAHDEVVETVLAHARRLRNAAPSPDDPDVVTVLRHVYWQHPTMPSRELSAASGFPSPSEMTAAIASVPSGIMCDGCGGRDAPYVEVVDATAANGL
jgi:hypothetical protein